MLQSLSLKISLLSFQGEKLSFLSKLPAHCEALHYLPLVLWRGVMDLFSSLLLYTLPCSPTTSIFLSPSSFFIVFSSKQVVSPSPPLSMLCRSSCLPNVLFYCSDLFVLARICPNVAHTPSTFLITVLFDLIIVPPILLPSCMGLTCHPTTALHHQCYCFLDFCLCCLL